MLFFVQVPNHDKFPFTLNQLLLIYAIASAGNFKYAAKKLFIAQSTLSTQIKNLETELNSSLFYRKRMRSNLTYNGQIFMRYVFRILALCYEGEYVISSSSLKKKTNSNCFNSDNWNTYYTSIGAEFTNI